jgi:hypothetical protein
MRAHQAVDYVDHPPCLSAPPRAPEAARARIRERGHDDELNDAKLKAAADASPTTDRPWPRAIGFSPIDGGLFLLGIVFGFVTPIVGRFDLTQAWLVIGYVLALFTRRSARRSPAPGDSR